MKRKLILGLYSQKDSAKAKKKKKSPWKLHLLSEYGLLPMIPQKMAEATSAT